MQPQGRVDRHVVEGVKLVHRRKHSFADQF